MFAQSFTAVACTLGGTVFSGDNLKVLTGTFGLFPLFIPGEMKVLCVSVSAPLEKSSIFAFNELTLPSSISFLISDDRDILSLLSDFLISTPVPVSYTHLDVYKRQE